MMQILALNGSIRGARGNSARLLQHAQQCAATPARLHTVHLADAAWDMAALQRRVLDSDALLLASGVYWNSYGSPLQRFLEATTAWETSDALVGKPVGALLSLDSVGGTDVAYRLLGALNLMGCWTPPLGVVVLSRVGLASEDRQDVYGLDDVGVLLNNLCQAAQQPRPAWQCWPVKSVAPPPAHLDPGAPLELDSPPWVPPPH